MVRQANNPGGFVAIIVTEQNVHEGNSSLTGTTQNPLGNILEMWAATYHLTDYLQTQHE